MDDKQHRLKIISGLLAPYAQSASGDPKEIVGAYIDAISDIPTMYVSEAARRHNAGKVPRHSLSFAPTPAELADEARNIWHAEIYREQRQRRLDEQLKLLPLPEYSEEEKAHRKAFTAAQLQRMNAPLADRNRPVPMSDLPQAVAVANLEAMSKRPKEQPRVSEVLRERISPSHTEAS